ncbi:hypothetical protein BASA50_011380 [Batrachochytrium salamandrivorans]|uniref:Elongation of fatty acids protein n=1 Tax=Batrachochytrium salamandrivorans TaxID=1357716 RepID=A0ABQ8EVT8_9FUNG|nr:hypothetical protein BASA50_011380 [Batrachochytrium salamandrivorans]KAH6602200.1 hypothetical protein BASA61_001360 [Batrachochytrium salamandrivorans]KAH9272387.1 hypothetical protein BASA83_005480 [Batrachochytrium salamandrivorans]KAJ1342112.1 hypothetical protein BSLG_003335 [Batrachochytrium salamandrivorans]
MTVLKTILSHALTVPFEDTALALAHASGQFLAPHVQPMEDWVMLLLNRHFPAQSAAFFHWIAAHQSPHTAKLAMMNPIHVLFAIMAYGTIVFVGCIIMRPLPRFSLKAFSFLHNLFLTLLSAYMAIRAMHLSKTHGYNVFTFGNSVDHSEAGSDMAKILWLFYFSKLPEFIDTFIMVLKKNFHQISFLHVYHHGSILAVQWLVVLWAPGGESALSTILNSSVHVVMYGYYLCMTLGWKSVSFIKPFITLFQMTQFCYLLTQGIVCWYMPSQDPTYSNYPPQLGAILVFYMLSMLALFGNFFIKDRRRAAKAKLDAKLKATKSQ